MTETSSRTRCSATAISATPGQGASAASTSSGETRKPPAFIMSRSIFSFATWKTRILAATIRDVARVSGVSVGTVSRSLNAPETVRPETLGKVRAAIQSLGFQPIRAPRTCAVETP
ncbi:LacI family DNA-binding transcriptional regulator [Mesorhizobium sp. M1295]|uniref:LacI family DNA-binding transcriptional regulator n=1 Tax=Mesorhizobium sp. M1295 TaxID=2957076 RepID=UPI003335696B